METTPLVNYPALSSILGIDLKVKHDDLFPFAGGGNKARKIKYILSAAEEENSNALVSAGAANSNHARVVAIAGAKKGWSVKLIIHDIEDFSKANLKLMTLAGAELIFVEMKDVAETMDKAMSNFLNSGHKPYYIWGGGHSIEGMKAYYDAVTEFKVQAKKWKPDFVILASGTGGTQSGLHLGFSNSYPETKVFGISVARKKERGLKVIENGVSELCSLLKVSNKTPIHFFDQWSGGGYEKFDSELMDTINFTAKTEGLIVDPTYTGKAFTGLLDLIENKTIPYGSKVLFWHTGGLLNLIS